MARTKQSARKSAGGKAPHKQLAYYYAESDSEPEPEPVDDSLAPLMTVETKYIERRWDSNSTLYTVEAGAPPKKSDNPDRWGMSVLVVTTYFKIDGGGISHRTLMVKSPYVRRLLQVVIGDKWTGVGFRSSMEEIHFPLEPFYHYFSDLEKGVEAATTGEVTNQAEILHLKYFMNFLVEEFKELRETLAGMLKQGSISYNLLWTIFKPKCLVYTTLRAHPQVMAFQQLKNTSEQNRTKKVHVSVFSKRVDYDGNRMGTVDNTTIIKPFFGTKKIEKLEVFPFEYHSRETFMRDRLILRGKKFESLQGINYMQFKGQAIAKGVANLAWPVPTVAFEESKRVVIDVARSGGGIYVTAFDAVGNQDDDDDYCGDYEEEEDGDMMDYDAISDVAPGKVELYELTDEQRLQCPAYMGGFCFDHKAWYIFPVENLYPVEWDPTAFDSLVIPELQKNLIKEVVQSHLTTKGCFDDFIPGKGKGLITAIYGPPGVGKTLTAESLADFVKKPLYPISSGELGTTSSELEANLRRILDHAARWDVVLLLDEADVFLESRSRQDLHRNALVAIFLRLLERYPGILFLTSNRVKSIDSAFLSRIHIALHYNELDKESRYAVWKNFAERVGAEKCKLTEGDLRSLAERTINGREIKNCVRIARGLSEVKGERMGMEHLGPVLQLVESSKAGLGGL